MSTEINGTAPTRIRGKVARLFNTRELAINVGSENGVTVGMLFDVLDPKYENIKDPDTGAILGSLQKAKVRVKIIAVQEKLSVAQTYKKKQVNLGGTGLSYASGSLAKMFLPPNFETIYETLKTTDKAWEDIDEKESYVKTGDPVVQVIPNTDEGGD